MLSVFILLSFWWPCFTLSSLSSSSQGRSQENIQPTTQAKTQERFEDGHCHCFRHGPMPVTMECFSYSICIFMEQPICIVPWLSAISLPSFWLKQIPPSILVSVSFSVRITAKALRNSCSVPKHYRATMLLPKRNVLSNCVELKFDRKIIPTISPRKPVISLIKSEKACWVFPQRKLFSFTFRILGE